MLVLPTTADQLRPGRRVAVFPTEDASGKTLGYFGTVVSRQRASELLPAENPESWSYSVRGPYHLGCQHVVASQILVDSEDETLVAAGLVEPAWQVRFDPEPDRACERITGRYRLANRSWARFTFEMSADDAPRYELRVPADALACETPALLWRVPRGAILNREYVWRTLSELFGK